MIWTAFVLKWLWLVLELSLLYLGITFLVELLLTFLSPAKIRQLLQGRRTVPAMLLASGLGAVTPFCSCSTVPVVSGMMRAGIPFAPLAAFLVMSPLVDPAIVALLVTWAGVGYAVGFVVACGLLSLLVGAFFAVTGLKPKLPQLPVVNGDEEDPVAASRAKDSAKAAWVSWTRLAPVFVLATGIGAILLTMVPTASLSGILGGHEWWRVPVAAIVGLPVYASTGMMVSIGTLLYAGGANLGVTTAFVIGATGFSIPEAILLKKLIGGRLLSVFAGLLLVGVVAIGYAFQVLGS